MQKIAEPAGVQRILAASELSSKPGTETAFGTFFPASCRLATTPFYTEMYNVKGDFTTQIHNG